MLSVVLYGRNDSHGYNLHKRAALSLNCIAQVLTDEDDEIIFVDYNTPDELPTFPEAIGDTLTETCRRRLRIIRVRPTYHAQFAARTRLVALESQSRNIAIRRANPSNRWILSTNTDMIFCSAPGSGSLSDLVGALEEGFYHLPRFEVPEGFWERLARNEPKAAIDAMRQEGKRFHLNEIVWGVPDNLFEAPGDFQLFQRSDLDRIEGFDERMLLGWHVDSNIARRMRLLRGEVLSLYPKLAGYHCGHTRQATSLHGGNRTENDMTVFVSGIEDPVARHQAGAWGAPDAVFEEVCLGSADAYLPAMAAAVPVEGPDVLEAVYNETSLNRVSMDACHVLPHLCDLLYNLPAGQEIFFCGPDAALLEGVRAFLEAAGKAPQFLLTDLAGCPGIAGLDQARWGASLRPLREAIDEADIFLIQYPSNDMQPEAARRDAQWWTQRVFLMITAAERRRPVASRRRVVVANAIHTGITSAVETSLAPTVTPFSSRLRQGFVLDDLAPPRFDPAEEAVYARLGRRRPFSVQDRTVLTRLFDSLKAGAPLAGWERLAPEVGAICASPKLAERNYGLTAEQARDWSATARVAMQTALTRPVEAPVAVGPRPTVPNRLLSGADWDDPEWGRMALTYIGYAAMDFAERKRWAWDRVSLALSLVQQLSPTLPGEGTTPRLLLLARWPEFLTAILVHLGYSVVYAQVNDFLAGRQTGDWTPGLDLSSLVLPRPLEAYVPGAATDFDAVVMTMPSLFEVTSPETDALLAAIHPLMAKDALLFTSATVQLNEIAYEGGLSYAEWKAIYAPEGPLGLRGFDPVGEVDLTVPLDTVVRFAFNDETKDSIPGLSYGFLKGFNTSAVLCARWPDQIRAGAQTKLEWTEPSRPDPAAIPLPYLGEGAASAGPVSSGPASEAARKAAWLLANTLEKVGMAAFADDATMLTFEGPPMNALPFITPLGKAERKPTSTTLTALGGAGFTLMVDAGELKSLSLNLGLSQDVTLGEVIVQRPWGPPIPHTYADGRLEMASTDALGRISVAVRLSAPEAEIKRLVLSAA